MTSGNAVEFGVHSEDDDRRVRRSRALRRFLDNKRAVVGVCILAILIAATVGAPLITGYSPNAVNLSQSMQPPSGSHWFGTDTVGRDYFARTLYGGRVSLGVGFSAMLIALIFGTVIGSMAGYFGGVLDELLSRGVDFFLSLPIFYIIVVAQMLLNPGTAGLVVLISLFFWMPVARLVRGLVLSERERDYVQAAHAIGSRSGRIIVRHLVPNIVGPIIVTASFNVGDAILIESALSFLGVGIQPPTATWGNMVIGAETYLLTAPWIAIFPGVMIALTVMSFMFLGDGFRDAFDTRMGDRA